MKCTASRHRVSDSSALLVGIVGQTVVGTEERSQQTTAAALLGQARERE